MARPSTRRRIRKKIRILWKREHLHASLFLNKLVKCLVRRGHRDLVIKQLYKSLLSFKAYTTAPIIFFFEACEKVKPALVLRTMRKGRDDLQIPFLVNDYKLYKVGVKWIASAIKASGSRSLNLDIVIELSKIVNENNSQALKRQQLLYGAALENRTLTHYRWSLD